MEMNLKIDPEFQNVLPRLSEEEYQKLEENLIVDGCRDPLVLWGDVIVDGHNRYEICKKYNIEFKTVQREFKDRDDVIVWIVDKQSGQRNLSSFVKAELALRIEPILKAKAKERQAQYYGNQYQKKSGQVQNSAQVQTNNNKTRDELAKIAGVSHNTIERVKKIKENADPETVNKVRNGEMTINKAYTQIRQKEADDGTGRVRMSKEECDEYSNIIQTLSDNEAMDYTIDHLTEQIRENADAFIKMLSNMITDHADICDGNIEKVIQALDQNITDRINQMKERLNNGTQL